MTSLPPSILAKAGSLDPYPFPHVVIPNALPEDYYWDLYNCFVALSPEDARHGNNNNRFNVEPHLVKEKHWQDFMDYHESAAFLDDIYRVFGARVEGKNKIEVRQAGNFPSKDGQQKVLGPHIDGGGIWFVGLFYMGSPEDQEGGDLQLCRWLGERRWTRANRCYDGYTEPVKTIPYQHNIFVGFVNSDDAVHMVSRRKSNTYRRFINILIRNSSIRLGSGDS